MLSAWWNKKVECSGSVLFRGSLPPRPEELPSLESIGFTVEDLGHGDGAHWVMRLKSPDLGSVRLIALRNPPRLPKEMVEWAIELTPEEKALALVGHAALSVNFEGGRENLLRDRKIMLRLLGTLMGTDGCVAIDHTAQKFWSRAALDDELLHDADVDIDALYNLHPIGDGERLLWLHSHGLAEIGLFDFDLIHPANDYVSLQIDGIRAIALAIAEGKLKPGGAPYLYAGDHVKIQAIDAAEFDRKASAADRAARESAHEDHVKARCVICEPVGWLRRLLGKTIQPCRYLQSAPDERIPLHLSSDTGALMAERARGSLAVLKQLMAEFAEFEFTAAAKIGYVIDNGDATDLEHMWFSINAIGDDSIDATLAVNPFNIARMRNGDRGHHPIAQLTDWLMVTPFGNITPRSTTAARLIRPHKDELRQALANAADSDN